MRALEIIRGQNVFLELNAVQVIKDPNQVRLSKILDCNKDVFDGSQGKANNFACDLVLRENSTPVYLKPRPLPFSIRDAVSNALRELEAADVIEQTDEICEWGTPIVPVIEKGKKLRICADYKST